MTFHESTNLEEKKQSKKSNIEYTETKTNAGTGSQNAIVQKERFKIL